MKYYKKIEGENIYLSPINIEDAETFTKWMNDKTIAINIGALSKVNNIESEKNWIKNILENRDTTFSIILKGNDELIGNCSLMDIKYIDKTAEIGILIGEAKYRGKGYGSEAIKLLLDYGFNVLNLHNINLKVFEFNKTAIACYKKIGFKEYGIRHECYYLDNKYHNEIMFEMLSSDFNEK